LLIALVAALGSGLWFSALFVRYRDIGYLIPVLMQLWLFSSPIAYSSNLLSARSQILYGVNPMVGVVEGMRYALVHRGPAPVLVIVVSAAAALILLISGLFFFRSMERRFADIV
jgi:lipopolysaccharide transport system permease protein